MAQVIDDETFDIVEVDTSKKLTVAREQLPLAQLTETANMLAKSTIVPITYQNRPENCFIALDMSSRMGVSFMMVMQNLYIIQGKPSWSGQAIASLVRSSPQFSEVTLHYVGEENTDSWGAYVTAIRNATGKTVKGGTVTIKIAKAEGWMQKTGSKWKTIPEIMLAYRAYAWFGRVHAPELMMGLQSSEEIEDTVVQHERALNPYKKDGGQ